PRRPGIYEPRDVVNRGSARQARAPEDARKVHLVAHVHPGEDRGERLVLGPLEQVGAPAPRCGEPGAAGIARERRAEWMAEAVSPCRKPGDGPPGPCTDTIQPARPRERIHWKGKPVTILHRHAVAEVPLSCAPQYPLAW